MQAWLRLTAGLLVAMTATTLALCAPPKAVIDAPPKLPIGATLFLECGDSTGDAFRVLQTSGESLYGRWFASEKCYIVSCPVAGEFGFTLAAAGIVDGKAAIDLQTVSVTIGEPPNPGPNPPGPNPPNPEPPLPPGRFGLAQWSRDTASATLATMPAAQRVESAKLLAGSFEGIAAAIAAGTIRTLDDVNAKTKESNNAALGAYAATWKPWAAQLNAKVASLDDAGQLKTSGDAREAWLEIATGLRAVK